MSTLAERMVMALDADESLSQAGLARACGISPPSISDWVSGETKSINTKYVFRAAEYLGVEPKWLGSGEGPMLAGDGNKSDDLPALPPSNNGHHFPIPQYDTGGKMGHGLVLQDQPGIIKRWDVSLDWLKANVPNCTSPKNLCIVTGFGDSMLGVFNPGDPILVDQGIRSCDHDGLYFFRVGKEGFIKRLQRIPGQGILVISQNQNYRDWMLPLDSDFEIFGKVLRAWNGSNY